MQTLALCFCKLIILFDPTNYNHHSFVTEEFSLEITDVQLEDDGKYNCQVTPTDDDPRVLLSDEVTVTVIGKSIISVVVCRQV